VFALLIVGVVVAVPVLYAADRIIKAQARARRLRTMSERPTAATARADKQHERRQQVTEASAELTSLMPAINRPLTLPDDPGPDQAGSPFLADHFGDARLGGARQRPEGVPVEVDQLRVVAYQAVPKTGQRVSRVKILGMGPLGGKRRHGPNPTDG